MSVGFYFKQILAQITFVATHLFSENFVEFECLCVYLHVWNVIACK